MDAHSITTDRTYQIAVDIGGTFTDLIIIDNEGAMSIVKTPSTPKDPSIGMIDAIHKAAHRLGMKVEELLNKTEVIVHGTTITTNALLTKTGAKTGLITTKGFRDILELRKGKRETLFNYKVPPHSPLVPRYLRIGVEERILWNGEIHTPLNKEDVLKALEFFKEKGVESIAVCLLWSFRNPVHEKEIGEMIQKEYPQAYASLSSEILPRIQEYARVSTTVLDAYVGPLLYRYVGRLRKSLKEMGYRNPLMLVQSNGGTMTADIAIKKACTTLLSGPASGPMAGIVFGRLEGFENLITVDMGGTSFDVCLVKEGTVTITDEGMISEYRLATPMVDIQTIGAGGGSVGWIDAGGMLHVGPRSAGADPGPACYGKGGKEPTVTDADLILGYLNPEYFLGGEMRLDVGLAKKAMERIANPLGKDIVEAAHGIFRVINTSMADLIGVVSVQRGENPRDYCLVCAGGAGPVHAARLAKDIGIPFVLIPKTSSVFCAFGMLSSDVRHDYIKTLNVRTAKLDLEIMNQYFYEMYRKSNETLEEEGIPLSDRYFSKSVDMRYVGQFHEVEVPIPADLPVTEKDVTEMVDLFHDRHEILYAYRDVVETEIINLKVVAFGRRVKPKIMEQPYAGKDSSSALKGRRGVFFEEMGQFIPTPIYDGEKTKHGNEITGPAIIEERTTTIVVPPEFKIRVGKYGDYIMEVPL